MSKQCRPSIVAALACGALAAAASDAEAQSARGDFNADGHTDLAIGAPNDTVQGQPGAGAVNILDGTRAGLTAYGDEQFTTAPLGIGSVPKRDAHFGAALATGDLNRDHYDDLAIGVPGDDPGGASAQPRSGVVIVLYGSGVGLRSRAAANLLSQNSAGVADTAEAGDAFGASLAIDDYDGDGDDDLAIGAPGEGVDGQPGAGAVHVLYGRPDALRTAGADFFTQNTSGIKGLAGAGHRFGAALEAGDLSHNGRADLAIGTPGGAIGGHANAGAALVLYGRAGGLSTVDDLWSQDARGIKGVAAADDRFGQALAIGDFDADGAGDLAVGVPNETVANALGAGAVNVIHGSGRGLREARDRRFSQDSRGIKSRASIGETFGSALAAGDFSGNGADDLAIGVPGEQVAGQVNAGAVTVLYGARRSGLGERADQHVTQASAGIKGRAGAADRLGDAVGTGDFDADGVWDLVVGVPGDAVGATADAGAVQAIYGTGGGLRALGDERWTQRTSGVKGQVGDDRFGSALAAGAG